MKFRPLRVSSLIRDELGVMLERELEIPRGTLATITEVDTSKKMDIARVRVSVWPSDKAEVVLRKLQASAGDLQHALLRKINIKPMPRLMFEIDHGPENAAAVEKALLDG